MEIYIDDVLVKSVKAELHITHLAEAFQVLKSYNMKLNPAKCAFGVSVGKFLGFIVNNRGIDVRAPPPGPLRRGVVPLTGYRGMSHAFFFRLRESSNPRQKGHIEMGSTLTTN